MQPAHDAGHRGAFRRAEAADHAVVDEPEAAVRQHEDVARVRVGVVHPVEQQLAAVHAHQRAHEAAQVVPPLAAAAAAATAAAATAAAAACQGGAQRHAEPELCGPAGDAEERGAHAAGRCGVGAHKRRGGRGHAEQVLPRAAARLEMVAHARHQQRAQLVGAAAQTQRTRDVGLLCLDGGGEGDAAQVLHSEHVTADQPVVGHGGDAHQVRLEAARAHVGAQLAQVCRLGPKVELGLVAAAQAPDKLHILGEEVSRHDLEVGEVGVVQRGHLGVLHLDDDLLPAQQCRAMRLRESGGAHWSRIEALEDLGHRQSDRRLDDRAHFRERARWHAVLQRPKRGDVSVLDYACANRRDQLAQLDVDATEREDDVDGRLSCPLVECGLARLQLLLGAAVPPLGPRLDALKLDDKRSDSAPKGDRASHAWAISVD
eukprot:scaffold92825_cov66-Phaeocystis_antarctica.AAC.4